MANFECDQAEGLRRMLAAPRPRIFTVVSAVSDDDKNATLTNLCASLVSAGSDVLLLDAIGGARGIAAHLGAMPVATLTDAAGQQGTSEQLVQRTAQGFGVAALRLSSDSTRKSGAKAQASTAVQDAERLVSVFDALARGADMLIVDAEPDADDNFPVAAMGNGDIVVLVSPGAQSIKNAYGLIKRLGSKLGKRPFSVLVTGATEQEAQVVYRNMAQAASRYLALQLTWLGTVPADEHMARAARLGRPVVDAFPMAHAAVAFRHLAGRFVDSGAQFIGAQAAATGR